MQRFSSLVAIRAALAASAIWLLLLYPLLNARHPELLPKRMRGNTSDFGQYYTGAVAARHKLWPQLYPKANQAIYGVPPTFQPKLNSPFFDYEHPERRLGVWPFYPQMATPEGSQVAPEILHYAPELQHGWHFILPPPMALILQPLSFFSLENAARCWFWLMCASLFGTGWISSRIFRLLIGKPSFTEAGIAILPLIPALLASNMSTALNVGNVSPFLGFLIALLAWFWMANRQVEMGFVLILLLLFKGLGLLWCLLLFFPPIKWKTIATLALLTILLNALTIYHGGIDLYRQFFKEVLPQVSIPLGTGIQGQLMSFLGIHSQRIFLLLSLILLAGLAFGYRRKQRAKVNLGKTETPLVAATMAGTMAAFCLFNPIVWPHYYSNYLLFPFAGWVVWETLQAQGLRRRALQIMLGLNLVFFLDGVFLLRDSWLIEWLQSTGHLSGGIATARSALNFFVVNIAPLLESAFLLSLAWRRIFKSEENRALETDQPLTI